MAEPGKESGKPLRGSGPGTFPSLCPSEYAMLLPDDDVIADDGMGAAVICGDVAGIQSLRSVDTFGPRLIKTYNSFTKSLMIMTSVYSFI